ncbi:MAG: POT family MFS transporter [Planctomycetota bacterium]|nr:POT family MFS transporter [Planctomycetota bacterium]
MSDTAYRTAPEASSKMPAGIPYIVGNEAAERFSFYGMKTILFVFMTKYLMSTAHDGSRAVLTDDEAKEYVHLFVASAYFFPILGAIVSDALWGKYRTIMVLSVVYCLGHLALALDETMIGLMSGLILISVGTGAIKPCVSAHVGDQFGAQNHHLLSKVFGWFYCAINLGAAISTVLTPWLLAEYGPSVAFGVPGVLMFLATVVFWMGRHKFIHVPPSGMKSVRDAFSGEGLKAIANLALVFVFVAVFWSLFDQTGSAWIQQARRMDRTVWLPHFDFSSFTVSIGETELLSSQIQAANPILILILVPLFSYWLYPAISRFFPLTPLRKVGIGLFLTVVAFALPAWVEGQINGGEVISSTSEGDTNDWPVERLLDGDETSSGWVSSEFKKGFKKQEIVIRLRERRAWKLDKIQVRHNPDMRQFLDEKLLEGDTEKAASTCRAREIEFFSGTTRLGDPVENADGAKKWTWTRSLGKLELSATDPVATSAELNVNGVETEYVMVRINSNHGGGYVGLGEIAVLRTGSQTLPSDERQPSEQDLADGSTNVAAIGHRPTIVWQLLAYLLMTAAEVMVSITCLEFSYTQAPNSMKSFIMSLYLLSVSAGNLFTAGVNHFIQAEDKSSTLEGASYYWFFTAVMLFTAVLFVFTSQFYRGKTYIQEEAKHT